ncbi:MAG: DUF2484 family protein [Pseudomonadota bacterium]
MTAISLPLLLALGWVIVASVSAFFSVRWHWRFFYVLIPTAAVVALLLGREYGIEAALAFVAVVAFKYRLAIRYFARRAWARWRGGGTGQ